MPLMGNQMTQKKDQLHQILIIKTIKVKVAWILISNLIKEIL